MNHPISHTYALIGLGGFVVNVIVAPESFVESFGDSAVVMDDLDPMPGIGWSYLRGVFTPPA